jgi:drug/metabolite transporter (DMT)-like permease
VTRLREARGYAALATAAAIWGSTFIATKWVVKDIGPFTLAALRFLIATAVLLPLAWRQGYRFRISLRPRFLVLGLIGIAPHYALQNVALLWTTAASAALIVGGIPAATALLSRWVLKEPLSLRQAGGIGFSIVGVGLITGGAIDASASALLGDLLVVGSIFAWAIYTVEGKTLSEGYTASAITVAGMVSALFLLVPAALVEVAVDRPPTFSTGGVAGLLYLALAASALTFYLWNRGLRAVKASVAGTFINLVPVLGFVFGIASGESIAPIQVVGGAVALCGVWIATKQRGAERPRREEIDDHGRAQRQPGLRPVRQPATRRAR